MWIMRILATAMGFAALMFTPAEGQRIRQPRTEQILLERAAAQLQQDTTIALSRTAGLVGWDIVLDVPAPEQNDFDLIIYLEDPAENEFAPTACVSDGVGAVEWCRVFPESSQEVVWITVLSLQASGTAPVRLRVAELSGLRLGTTIVLSSEAQPLGQDTPVVREFRYEQGVPGEGGLHAFSIAGISTDLDSVFLNVFARGHDVEATTTVIDSEGNVSGLRATGSAVQLRIPAGSQARYLLLEVPVDARTSRSRLVYEIAVTRNPLPTPVTLSATPTVLRGVGPKEYRIELPVGWTATAVLEGSGAAFTVMEDTVRQPVMRDARGTQSVVFIGEPIQELFGVLRGASRPRTVQLHVEHMDDLDAWSLTLIGVEQRGAARVRFARDSVVLLPSLRGSVPDTLQPGSVRAYWISRHIASSDLAWDTEEGRDSGLPPFVASLLGNDAAEALVLAITDEWGTVRTLGRGRVAWRWRRGDQGAFLIVTRSTPPQPPVTTDLVERRTPYVLEFWPARR